MKATRRGYEWIKQRIAALTDITLADDELRFLKEKCPYLPEKYLNFLKSFRFKPQEQVVVKFTEMKELSKRAELEELCQAEKGEVFVSIFLLGSSAW